MEVEEVDERGSLLRRDGARCGDVETNSLQSLGDRLVISLATVFERSVFDRKPVRMRADPVGQHNKACETMVEGRLRGQRSASLCKRLRKREPSSPCDFQYGFHWIPCPSRTPPLGLREAEKPVSLAAKAQGTSMVGENGHQVAERVFLSVEPFPHLRRQAV